MRKVTFMRAFEDRTWDLLEVDVPSVYDDPKGVDFRYCVVDSELEYYIKHFLINQECDKKIIIMIPYSYERGEDADRN